MAYIGHLVLCLREWWRVLRDDGTCWVNLGDSYASSPSGNQTWKGWQMGGVKDARWNYESRSTVVSGLKPKDLCGMPWRLAFAAQADGWWLRSDIVWAKPNPMPESVTDRPTKAHEYVFLLTKNSRYYYDNDAVREAYTPTTLARMQYSAIPSNGKTTANIMTGGEGNMLPTGVTRTTAGLVSHEAKDNGGRNLRTVWTIATQPTPFAHFATYPEKLVEPCIKAGSRSGDWILDPFHGSGTTGVVATRLGRLYIGIDMSREYLTDVTRQRFKKAKVSIFAALDGDA